MCGSTQMKPPTLLLPPTLDRAFLNFPTVTCNGCSIK